MTNNEANESQQQPYDRALKSLMEDHAAEMLAELVPESRLIEERNSEITRLNLRADIVCLIDYKGKRHILNMELQTESEKDMVLRMLMYHIELFAKYRLPVISIVLYPFETNIPEPVFQEESVDEILLEFRHRVVRLWTIEAALFIHRRVVSMYTLLPAMKGVTAPMLLQAIGEMEQSYTGDHLSRHLRRFRTILRRSKTLSAQDKQIVEERMRSYDSLLESDPEFQQRMAEIRLESKREAVTELVEARFPALIEIAQQQVVRLTKLEALSLLHKQIGLAPDENIARWILSTSTALDTTSPSQADSGV
jgi:hypothetical protein